MKRIAIIVHKEYGICAGFVGDNIWMYPTEIILDWYAETYAIDRKGLYMLLACPIDEPPVKELEKHLIEWQKRNSPKSRKIENAIENATIV